MSEITVMKKEMKTAPDRKQGFTLIELLVAISILGTMASLILFALAGAQTDARVARTRSTISKLNEIVLQRWEEYRYRAVNVTLPPALQTNVVNGAATSAALAKPVSPRELARVRMVMLRDMMRMELPDRASDVLFGPTEYTVAFRNPAAPSGTAAVNLPRPIPAGWGVIYNALRSRIQGLKNDPRYAANWASANMVNINDPAQGFSVSALAPSTGPAFLGNPPSRVESTLPAWTEAIQSSELLYLIVSTSNYNGSSALEQFRPTEIGDTDDDGLLEFIDAWGQPIVWLRWPAGYSGDLVRYAGADAMDPLKTDWRYRAQVGGAAVDEDWHPRTLVPLIMSRGQDGQLGVITDFFDSVNGRPPIAYATMTWPTASAGKPYGTGVYGVAGVHYGAAGPYYYPDPNFTYDYSSDLPNQTDSEKPWNIDGPRGAMHGFRRNQIGAIPKFIDFNGLDTPGTIVNDVWQDNITSHDIILEP